MQYFEIKLVFHILDTDCIFGNECYVCENSDPTILPFAKLRTAVNLNPV